VTTATRPNHLLTRARFNAGLSIRGLADAASVSPSTIVNLEKHGRPPRADIAKRIADVFGLRPTDIFELPLPGDDQETAAA